MVKRQKESDKVDRDSDNLDKDFDRLTKLVKAEALAELIDVQKFNLRVIELAGTDPEKMVEEVEANDPEFIEHFQSTRAKPWSAFDFWTSFVMWSVNKVRAKYPEIWKEVADAFLHSPTVKHMKDDFFLTSAMQEIEEIIENSDLGENNKEKQ